MCWGQAAYCREAQESPGSVSPPWKTYSTRRSMKRSPRRKQPEGAETQLNLREQVRRIQLETLRPPFVSVIGIILPVVIAVESLSCVWLFRHPNDCSLSDSSVHGILQAKILEWVAISFSGRSFHPGLNPRLLLIIYHWATREALTFLGDGQNILPPQKWSHKDESVCLSNIQVEYLLPKAWDSHGLQHHHQSFLLLAPLHLKHLLLPFEECLQDLLKVKLWKRGVDKLKQHHLNLVAFSNSWRINQKTRANFQRQNCTNT